MTEIETVIESGIEMAHATETETGTATGEVVLAVPNAGRGIMIATDGIQGERRGGVSATPEMSGAIEIEIVTVMEGVTETGTGETEETGTGTGTETGIGTGDEKTVVIAREIETPGIKTVTVTETEMQDETESGRGMGDAIGIPHDATGNMIAISIAINLGGAS